MRRAAVAGVLAVLVASSAALAQAGESAPTGGAASMAASGIGRHADDAATWIAFVVDDSAACSQRDARRLLVRNVHATRTVRVWLDRTLAGRGTGDRSRTELRAGAEPEPLGCDRSSGGPQAWTVVRAQFVD